MALWDGFPYTYDALTYMYDDSVKYAPLTHKFTGKERDAESGLDDFGARQYSSSMGRFLKPDPIFGSTDHTKNPQRWNEYSYVLNDPLAGGTPLTAFLIGS